MRKASEILRGKQGMTLIEIVVGMLLFTIIAASVSAVFVPLLKIYDRSNELAEINTLLDNLSDQLLNELATATAIEIAGSEITATSSLGKVAFDVDADGLLCRAGVPVLQKRYYKGKSVGLAYLSAGGAPILSDNSVDEAFLIKLTILSDRDGLELASREYAVNPLSAVFQQYAAG